MRDFEVLTLKDDQYVMQVNKEMYSVPHKWRKLNTVKLAALFAKPGTFKPYRPQVKPSA